MQLIEAGMDAARLNFSHGEAEEHKRVAALIRRAARHAGRPVAILGDVSGPKLRVGKMENGGVQLAEGALVRLAYGNLTGTADLLTHGYERLAQDVHIGDPVLIDDGLIRLEVVGVEDDEVVCMVKVGGVVKDHKGLNLPQTELSVPALTEKDKRDIELAREIGVDLLALSFVRRAADIVEAKQLAGDIPIIAKIEKPQAVENLDEILAVADGIMVARGDLGVEVGHEKVPLIQKRIIRAIRPYAKPVITATQMLESMIHNPTPTRAEASDVANAVLDGTDAVMLSGETAVGKYPLQAVSTMRTIIQEIEDNRPLELPIEPIQALDCSFSSAIAEAVVGAQREMGLAAIAVYSQSGRTVRLVSAERPGAPIIAFSPNNEVLNRLAICWGVMPVFGRWVHRVASIVEQTESEILNRKLAEPGQDVAITFGLVFGDEPFQTNMLKLWKLRVDRSHSLE
jgi:pyruvate kinase